MQSTSGFTAIELMIVVAITGVVGALAFSAYRTFTVRDEVTEGIEVANSHKPFVVDAFKRSGEAPFDRVAAGLPSAFAPAKESVVASVEVQNGRIDVVYGGRADPAIASRRLSLTPYETAGLTVVWVCGNEIPGPGLKPLGFSGGGRQAQQIPATVEARYLPSTCR